MGVGVKTWSRKECLAFMTFACVAVSNVHVVLGETRSAAVALPRLLDPSSEWRLTTDRSFSAVVAQAGSASSSASRRSSPSSVQPSETGSSNGEEVFTIRDFFVQGNNLLLPDQVQSILAPFIGPRRSFKDIEAARAALEEAYHKLGYPTIAVTVPEQTVEFGVFTLVVYEGRLQSIEVTENRFFSDDYVRRKLPAIRLGALLHEPTVLKQLDTLNANPDIKVMPILRPSDEPGQLNLDLKVKDRVPVHAKVELNNRGVPTTPLLRLNAALQYTNLFDADHVITLQPSQTPQDWGAVEVYRGNYIMPLRTPDESLVFYGAGASSRAHLATSPIPVGGGLDVIGNSIIAGARYFLPLGSGQIMKHQLAFGIDYKHLGRSETTLPEGLGNVTVSNPLTYTPASLGYIGVLQDDHGSTKFTASARGYVAGLVPDGSEEDFGGDPNDPLNMPGLRHGSTGTFAVIQGGLDRFLTLPREFSLSVKADGQWGSQPLVPTEQYFAGGMESVRGYREYQAAGDDAVHAMVELATPPFPKWPLEHIQRTLRFVTFFDMAYLWVKQPLPGQIPSWNLQGTGVGLRFTLSDNLRFRYDAAWALKPGPFAPAGSYFGHFSLEAVF